MIVQAQVTINSADTSIKAHLTSHPSILERSLLYYRAVGDHLIITTRLQIEANTIEHAQQIFTDAFQLETPNEPNVDEASLPHIQLTELDEN